MAASSSSAGASSSSSSTLTYSPIRNLNLGRAVSDVYYSSRGGLFRPDFDALIDDLTSLKNKDLLLPREYQESVLDPFIDFLTGLGKEKFDIIMGPNESILTDDQPLFRQLIPDIAEALLQRSHQDKYYESAFQDLQAFQAIVSTIHNVALAKNVTTELPPLAVWSSRRRGPYTHPANKTNKVGVKAAIVCLPPEHRTGGLLAWSSLGHEIAGHNLLRAQQGLIRELSGKVLKAVNNKGKRQFPKAKCIDRLATYWSERVEELASDVLGVLNMGPSSAIGFVGYLRGARGGPLKIGGPFHSRKSTKILHLYSETDGGFNQWFDRIGKDVKLSGKKGLFGYERDSEDAVQYEKHFTLQDVHPVDCLRVYSMIKVIMLIKGLQEETQVGWVDLIKREVDKDLHGTSVIKLEEMDSSKEVPERVFIDIPLDIAIRTAEIAAEVIATSKIKCLKQRSFIDIIPWTDRDEVLVDQIRQALRDNAPIRDISKKVRHIVAAALIESLEASNPKIETLFQRMKLLLVEAFSSMPIWTSLEQS